MDKELLLSPEHRRKIIETLPLGVSAIDALLSAQVIKDETRITELGIAGYRLPDKPSREAIKKIIMKSFSLNYPEVKTLGDIADKAAGKILALTPEVLSDEELEAIYKKTYAEALKWSEKYEVGLSAKNWNPNRPADRERWFCTQHTNQIMRAVAQAQLDKGE